MATNKKNLFNRLTEASKNAPLQESAGGDVKKLETPALAVKKTKVGRKPKNLQIPEDLWEAYDWLKENNTTSLLMTPYILEAFREKLAKDGAFDKNK
ncbi:molecular chaperone [Serratia fonticola]|uniref:Molecular chaperone n=1 Tax=Serratia fonticola TaxID=47917 RepID=A0AAW3WV96_SERFO|nr:molecular chaperone [Serratia fonticola]MBC3214761.1 molecular chaperone [Serratia fonticola]NYA15846.1 molecular chaperone [Serratia fonticola]NYA35682.1 molecular chaperone [Serratia fonticola]